MTDRPPKLLVIAGPTASGKKTLALACARRFGGEIVSVDSRKVYRGLDIGTAKPPTADRQAVAHHLIDIVDIGMPFSAGDWVAAARAAVVDIRARGKLPILSGGTGFYLAAFMEGLSTGIEPDEAVRGELDRELALHGPAHLHGLLAAVDPRRAAELHENDTVRVLRALEIHRTTGRPFSALAEQAPPRGEDADYVLAGITRERTELYRRCDSRVDAMVAAGLEAEVAAHLDGGIPRDTQALDTVGYREWFGCFDGDRSREDTIALIKQNTRRYAKRQLTWFGARPGFTWYDPDRAGDRDRLEADIDRWLGGEEPAK